MDIETIYGQVIAKANSYMAVPSATGGKRIIKNDNIRNYEKSFFRQCKVYKGRRISVRFRLHLIVWHKSVRYDLDNSIKTILDCLQDVEAITNDSQCFEIIAKKKIDKRNPRIEFGIEIINEQLNILL